MKKVVVSAQTKNPNTAETDKEPTVMHVVSLTGGESIEVMASAPMDAMEKVRRRLESEES